MMTELSLQRMGCNLQLRDIALGWKVFMVMSVSRAEALFLVDHKTRIKEVVFVYELYVERASKRQ